MIEANAMSFSSQCRHTAAVPCNHDGSMRIRLAYAGKARGQVLPDDAQLGRRRCDVPVLLQRLFGGSGNAGSDVSLSVLDERYVRGKMNHDVSLQ